MKKLLFLFTMLLTMMVVRAQVQIPIFSEDFEGGAMPTGWTTIDANNDGFDWTIGVGGHNGSEGMIYSESWNDVSGPGAILPNNWLITPAITLTGNSTLKFWRKASSGAFSAEKYDVYVSTTSATAVTSFTSLNAETTLNNGQWAEHVIDLSAYAGQTIYIAFRHYDCSAQERLVLDDVTVYTTPNTQTLLTNISSVDFGTVPMNDFSQAREVTVLGALLSEDITATVTAPFEISTDNVNFSSSVSLDDEGGVLYVRYAPTAVGSHTATLTLTSGTLSTTVALTGASIDCTVMLPLVESFENNDIFNCWPIYSANTENTISLSSEFSTDSSKSVRFSSYNYAINYNFNQYLITPTLPTDVAKMVSFDYRNYSTTSEKFRVGYSTTTNNLDEFTWGEYITSNTESWTEYFNPTIPAEAKYIAINYNPGDSKFYFYIDNFQVSELPACMYPTNLAVNHITGHAATLSWTPAVNVNGTETFYVEYREAGTEDEWQQQSTQESSIELSGLAPLTAYNVRLYMDCGDATTDTLTTSFVTVEACRMPSNLTVSQIAGSSALVSWTPDYTFDGTQQFIVEYATTDSGATVQSINVSDNHCFITGLDQQTEYIVNLYMDCATDGYSDTLTETFTTTCIAGGDVTIAGGTLSETELPSYNNFNYCYSQQIFLASELGGAAEFQSIAFESSSLNVNRNIKIYLMHTMAENSSSWLNASNAQLVYSGPITLGSGWNTYNFIAPFEYNGTANIALIVVDTTGTWSNTQNYWKSHYAFSQCSRVIYNDNNPYSITTTPDATENIYSRRNNVKFGSACVTENICAAPNAMIEEVTANEITLSWVPGYDETSWELQYKTPAATEWTTEGTVIESPYTLYNLQMGTDYLVRIGTVCGENVIWTELSATTECAELTLPFAENFDSYTSGSSSAPYCWEKSGWSQISTEQASSAYNSLSMNNGAMVILPVAEESVAMNDLMVAFDIYSAMELGTIEVGVMTDPENSSTFEVVGTYTLTQAGEWKHAEIFTNDYEGMGRYIAIRVVSGNDNWMSPYIDNVTVNQIPTCFHVTNIAAQNITQTSATITWTAGGDEEEWDYVYAPVGEVDEINYNTVYEESVVLSNLEPNTAYEVWVRATCSGGSSEWETYSFRTDCGSISLLPYTENFDSYTLNNNASDKPYCWSFPVTYDGYPRIQGGGYMSSSNTLVFKSETTTPSVAVLPQINANLHDLRLTFTMTAGSDGYLEVGVMSNPQDTAFELVSAVQSSDYEDQNAIIDFDNTTLTGTDKYIVIRYTAQDEWSSCRIDDVKIDFIPACTAPTNLTVTALTATSVDVAWTPVTGETSYQVYVYPTAQTPDYTEAVTVNNDTIYTDETLQGNTDYTVMVRTICANEEGYSEWISTTFRTPSANPAELPYYTGFDDYTENDEWVILNNTTGNQWFIGMPSDATDNFLYISADNGLTNSYVPSPCQVWAYRDIEMPAAGEFEVRIKWACGGGINYNNMIAFFGDVNDVTASTSGSIPMPPAGTVQLGGENHQFYNQQNTAWFTQTLDASMGGEVKRLYFVWHNDNSTVNPPAIRIDSVIITSSDCGRPINVTVTNTLPTAATVSFTPAVSTDEAWEYVVTEGYDPSEDTLVPVAITTTTFSISGLTPSTMYRVYVRTNCNGGYSAWSNYATFTTLESCPAPTNISLVTATATTADIAWTEVGTASAWTVEYGVAGFTPGTGTAASVTGTPTYSIAGLTAGTQYDVYVMANCSSTDSSEAAMFTFATACEPLAVPYSEGFENYTGTTYDSEGIVPTCWSNYTTSTYPAPHITTYMYGDNYANSGSNALMFTATNNTSAMAILPEFSTPLNQLQMSFYYRMENSAESGVLAVGYVTDVDDPMNTFSTCAIVDFVTTITLHEMSFETISNIPAGARIAFKWSWNGSWWYSCGIDDILVELVSHCDAPTNLAVSNVSQTGATATWTAGNEESAWNVQYKEASATEWGNSINVTEATYTFSGLTASTAYQVRVQAVCGTDETSDWTNAVDFTTLEESVETCPAPTGLATVEVYNESIELTWNQEANTANSWEVQYRVQGSETWSNATATAVPYTLTGLTGLTTYEIQVLANCTNGLTSDPSNMLTVTTTNVGISSYDLEGSVILYPNPTASNVTISAQGMMESVSLYDVYGKLISTMKVNDTNATVDMSDYASGVYFAKITTENGVVTKRIVKK